MRADFFRLVALVVGASACSADDHRALIIVDLVTSAGLKIDQARVDVVPRYGERQSTTVAWPAPPRNELEVRIQAEVLSGNPQSSGARGDIPGKYEDYRARVGVSAEEFVEAFGLSGGVEVALSEKKTVTLTPNSTTGPVTLMLAPR